MDPHLESGDISEPNKGRMGILWSVKRKTRKRKKKSLVEGPGDGNFTIGFRSDSGEGTIGKIEGVAGVAGWADIGDGDGHGFTIVEVGNSDAPAAVLGLLAHISVPSNVDGTNVVGVAVDCTAGTSNTILVCNNKVRM